MSSIVLHSSELAKQALIAYGQTTASDPGTVDLGRAKIAETLRRFSPEDLLQAQVSINEGAPLKAAKALQRGLHSLNIDITGPDAQLRSAHLPAKVMQQFQKLPPFDSAILTSLDLFSPPKETGFDPVNPSLTKIFTSGTEISDPSSPGAFFADASVEKSDPMAREWALNLAVCQHFASKSGVPEQAVNALKMRSLAYLCKFANIPDASQHRWQSTPIQSQSEVGLYHRGGGTNLYKGLQQQIATTLGVDPNNLFLSTDARIMDSVKRDFETHSGAGDFTTWDQNDFDSIFSAALADKNVFVDITAVLDSVGLRHTGIDGSKPVADVTDVATQLIVGALEAECYRRAAIQHGLGELTKTQVLRLKSGKIATAVRETVNGFLEKTTAHVTTGGMVKVGDQAALMAFPFNADAMPGQAETALALTEGGGQHERLQAILGHSGFTVGPNQLLANWSDLVDDPSEILGRLGAKELPSVDFGTELAIQRFRTFSDFLADPVVRSFAALGDNPGSPFATILPKATAKLIEGLGEEAVDKALREAGLGSFLQLSYNRMLGLMDHATQNTGDFNAFVNDIQLIHEEISTLLAVAQPHSATTFHQAVSAVTSMTPKDWPERLAPQFSLSNSATRAFAQVLTGCEAIKHGVAGTRQLNVAVQGDAYYEPSQYVLSGAKDHSQLKFDTSDVAKGAAAVKASLNDGKLDLYLCEFHHNIAYDRQSYAAEDVIAQVQALFDKGAVADKFTVAIDTTIASSDAPEIKAFLAHFKRQINDGCLNVVFYRSAQKFDQLGMDNYNGGIAMKVNRPGQFAAFDTGFTSAGDRLSDHNVQGMTHFNKYAQAELNAYRQGIMENTRKLGAADSDSPARLPATMQCVPDNVARSVLQIAVNNDPQAPFLDLRFPLVSGDNIAGALLYGPLMTRVVQKRLKDEPDKYTASTRASFGFVHSNFTLIDNVKMRFNPGLEDETTLGHFRDLFVDINDTLTQVWRDFQTLGDSPKKALAGMAGSIDDKTIRLFARIKAAGLAAAKEDMLALAKIWTLMTTPNPIGAERLLARLAGEYPAEVLQPLMEKAAMQKAALTE